MDKPRQAQQPSDRRPAVEVTFLSDGKPGGERVVIAIKPATQESLLLETGPDGRLLPPVKGRPGSPESR